MQRDKMICKNPSRLDTGTMNLGSVDAEKLGFTVLQGAAESEAFTKQLRKWPQKSAACLV